MDKPFVYDKYVTGRSFVGRKMDCNILGNLLEAGEHVVMYEPPKSGKMSVIQQTLFNLRAKGKQFMVIHINMLNVRTIEDFLVKYGTSVIRPKVTETTALGAAYLAGLAVGYWESIDHIKSQWGIEKEFTPQADAETVEALKEGWADAIRRTLTDK